MRKGDFRKAAIIDAAEKLFYQNGYENTSVQDVLDELHLSKGGFYHHFESKLSLLEAICQRRMEASFEECAAKLDGSSMTPAEKLNTVFALSTYLGQSSTDFKLIMLCVAYRDKASMLREQSRLTSIQLMQPLTAAIIREGAEASVFKASNPDITARIVLNLCFDLADEVSNTMVVTGDVLECASQVQQNKSAYSAACEAILGANANTIDLLDTKAAGELLIAYSGAK